MRGGCRTSKEVLYDRKLTKFIAQSWLGTYGMSDEFLISTVG
jgi:hypothetical protein